MHIEKFLHNLLGNTIHFKRIKLLNTLVIGLIHSKSMKLTTLGRSLDGKEKQSIYKVNRYLSNKYFQTHSTEIYQSIIHRVIGKKIRPAIIVDWSNIPNSKEYILRAALVADGRAITLYEEVHSEKEQNTPKVERAFLYQLSQLLPEGCQPIIITDAGYHNPWFRCVLELGWDFIIFAWGGT